MRRGPAKNGLGAAIAPSPSRKAAESPSPSQIPDESTSPSPILDDGHRTKLYSRRPGGKSASCGGYTRTLSLMASRSCSIGCTWREISAEITLAEGGPAGKRLGEGAPAGIALAEGEVTLCKPILRRLALAKWKTSRLTLAKRESIWAHPRQADSQQIDQIQAECRQ